MKKLYLHIGYNKTGSTSIQQNLVLNAGKLLELGFLYPHDPKATYTQRIQHAPLAAALPGMKLDWLTPRKKKTLSQAYDDFSKAISQKQFEALIISSEGFGSPRVTKSQIEWLKEELRDYDVKVIAYIRPQDSYLISAYQEKVKAGSKSPFEFAKHKSMPSLKFSKRLSAWREVFGQNNVIVRPFVPSLWHGGDLFNDFLNILNIQGEDFAKAPIANEGMDYRAIELLRRFNTLDFKSPNDRRKCVELCLNLEEYLPAGFTKQKMKLSSEQSEKLRLFYNADNTTALAGSNVSVEDFFPIAAPGRPSIQSKGQIDSDLLVQLIAALQLKLKV